MEIDKEGLYDGKFTKIKIISEHHLTVLEVSRNLWLHGSSMLRTSIGFIVLVAFHSCIVDNMDDVVFMHVHFGPCMVHVPNNMA
jgi:hypothetical protein